MDSCCPMILPEHLHTAHSEWTASANGLTYTTFIYANMSNPAATNKRKRWGYGRIHISDTSCLVSPTCSWSQAPQEIDFVIFSSYASLIKSTDGCQTVSGGHVSTNFNEQKAVDHVKGVFDDRYMVRVTFPFTGKHEPGHVPTNDMILKMPGNCLIKINVLLYISYYARTLSDMFDIHK